MRNLLLAPTAKPPFAWENIQLCISIYEREIRFAEDRLQAVMRCAAGPIRSWDYERMPWLAALVTSIPTLPVGYRNIGSGETRSQPLHQKQFIDTFLRDAFALPGSSVNCLNLARQAKLFRNKRVFSYASADVVDLQYYDCASIESELGLLLHAVTGRPGMPRALVAVACAAHFIAIHPFMDGNGRAARRLLVGLLRRMKLWGDEPLPLSFLLSQDRKQFVSCTRSLILDGKCELFIPYMMSALAAAAELAALLRHFQERERVNESAH